MEVKLHLHQLENLKKDLNKMKKSELRSIIREVLAEQTANKEQSNQPGREAPQQGPTGAGQETQIRSELKALNLNLSDQQEKGILSWLLSKIFGINPEVNI